MAKSARKSKTDSVNTETDIMKKLVQENYLFKEQDENWLADCLHPDTLKIEKLYSNRPVYTAFRPGVSLNVLYILLNGGPVIIRSTPLDRVIAITYQGSCFGMRNLPLSYGEICKAFPSLVEAYKTTEVIKIPLETLQIMYDENQIFRDRYNYLFELREKFEYHLLNCSSYPPQAVASILRALVYQERALGSQPNQEGIYIFDLSVDLIARACQLNHRTVEQVLKGMQKIGLLETAKSDDVSSDTVRVIDAEGLKEPYSCTRDKVAWWPLRN